MQPMIEQATTSKYEVEARAFEAVAAAMRAQREALERAEDDPTDENDAAEAEASDALWEAFVAAQAIELPANPAIRCAAETAHAATEECESSAENCDAEALYRLVASLLRLAGR